MPITHGLLGQSTINRDNNQQQFIQVRKYKKEKLKNENVITKKKLINYKYQIIPIVSIFLFSRIARIEKFSILFILPLGSLPFQIDMHHSLYVCFSFYYSYF